MPGGFVFDQQSEIGPVPPLLGQLETVLPFDRVMLVGAARSLFVDGVNLAEPEIGETAPHAEFVRLRAVARRIVVEIAEAAILNFVFALDHRGRIDLERRGFGRCGYGRAEERGDGRKGDGGKRGRSGHGQGTTNREHQDTYDKNCYCVNEDLNAGGLVHIAHKGVQKLSGNGALVDQPGGIPKLLAERRQQTRLQEKPGRLGSEPRGQQQDHDSSDGKKMAQRNTQDAEVQQRAHENAGSEPR